MSQNEVTADENLFSRLFKYRPREGRLPAEDFVTEAYAAVLLSDRKTAAAMLSKLFDLPTQLSSDFKIRTQATYEIDRPDMEIQDDHYWIFQENKIGSPLYADQVKSYQQRLKLVAPDSVKRLVVSCVLYGDPPESNTSPPYRPIRWSEFYTAVQEAIPTVRDPSKIIWQQFLGFLKERGMDPFSGLKPKCNEALLEVDNLRASSEKLLEAIIEDGFVAKGEAEVIKNSRSKNPNIIYKDILGFKGFSALPEIALTRDGVQLVLTLIVGDASPSIDAARIPLNSHFTAPYGPDGNLVARKTLSTEFFELDSQQQIAAAVAWYKEKLAPLRP